jgi:redox-sensing transcriptional repressor
VKKISAKIVSRAFLYIRNLDKLLQEKKEFVSSAELASMTGVTDVQIRKDISHFAKAGKPRVGYRISELKRILEHFVHQNVVHAVLFGVGNLGSAILKYPGFHQEKVQIVAAFDRDRRKIGQVLNGVRVYAVENAAQLISKSHAEIGIIAVPKEFSQQAADTLVAAGLRGIINFSPTTVNVPPKVTVRNIDLAIEFLSLFCDIRRP